MDLPIINNEHIKLEPYCDELFDLHLCLREEIYPTLTRVIKESKNGLTGYRTNLQESNETIWLVRNQTTDELSERF